MTRRTRLRKAGRIAGYAAAGLVALGVLVAIVAPLYFRAGRFGRLIERVLPEMRGHVHVGGGHWSWGTVIALLRERPAPLAIDDLTITDPEGTEVLHIDRFTFNVEVHRRPTRVLVRDLQVTGARWRFARMKKQNKVGFLAALEGVPRAARKPSKPPTSTEFAIEGARLDGVETTFDQSTWGLVLRDVHATGALAFRAKTFTFEVKDADVRGGGQLRILSEKSGVVWPFERGRLDRVATTADAPDSIRLQASGIETGRSRTSGAGVFTGIYGLSPESKHPGIDLTARMTNAADAANAIAARRGLGRRLQVGGADADIHLRFKEPFDRIAIDAEARGFDVKSGDIDVRKLGFHVAAVPQAGRIRVDRLSLSSPEGGRLEGEATLDRLQVDATVNATRFAARTLLPSPLRPFAAGTLDGLLHARADLLGGDAELVRSTLVVTRAEEEQGPRKVALLAGKGARPPPGATVVRLSGARLVDGVLRIPRVDLSMWGGGFSAEGRIALWDPGERRWLSPPRLDLTLQGSGLHIERLVGSGFAHGGISFRARARGTTDELGLDLAFLEPHVITVLGEKVRLPAQAELRLADSTIDLGNLPLGGPGDSQLIVSGRIALSGRLGLDVGVVRFPIARLPGLSSTTLPVGGSISGGVRIVGALRAPALSGEFTLADVTIAKTSLGGGTIKISPERQGAVRARGHLTDAIEIDGRLAPKASGLEGDVTLTLSKLSLDPFLPQLPGGLKAGGVISGTGTARIAPGEPATAEVKLSELALSLSSSDPRGKTPATVELRAQNEIVVRARAGDGLSLSPARFRSGSGWIELAGESHRDAQRASLRGHLDLGEAAPFARTWFSGLAGLLEVDLAASAAGAASGISLDGSVAVATPVRARLAAFPVDATIPSGRLRMTKNVVETTALPIAVRAERFPAAAVRKLEADLRVSARIDGATTHPKVTARVALDRLEVQVPLVGRKPVRSAGGEIDIAGDLTTGKLDVTRIDLPIAGEAEGLNASAGATVDRATVALRVKGNARQLLLTGDVDVASAHVRADALKSGGGQGGTSGAPGGKKGPLAGHPEIEAMRLDVRVRSNGGAVQVDVNNLPDLRIDLDMRVTGTAKKPSISGAPRGANVWSSFVLALAKLFS